MLLHEGSNRLHQYHGQITVSEHSLDLKPWFSCCKRIWAPKQDPQTRGKPGIAPSRQGWSLSMRNLYSKPNSQSCFSLFPKWAHMQMEQRPAPACQEKAGKIMWSEAVICPLFTADNRVCPARSGIPSHERCDLWSYNTMHNKATDYNRMICIA